MAASSSDGAHVPAPAPESALALVPFTRDPETLSRLKVPQTFIRLYRDVHQDKSVHQYLYNELTTEIFDLPSDTAEI